MGKIWIFAIAILIFLIFVFLFWRLTHKGMKKEYGMKMWKLGSSRLSYWQAAVLYSTGLTIITLFLLKWLKVLSF